MQIASFWLGLATVASGPIVATRGIDDANGLLQRAAIWPFLAWATAVSVKLYFLTRAAK